MEGELDEAGYVDAVRRLPRPTDGQCRKFAVHMGQRHSWFKHVSIHPGVPFRFLVGPQAQLLSDWGNRIPDRGQVHVTTPSDHLREYGHWTCVAPFGMYMGLATEHVEKVRRAKGWWVTSPDGRRLVVPESLVEMGRVEVNAFVHPKSQRIFTGVWMRYDEGPDTFGVLPYLESIGHPAPEGLTPVERMHHFEAVVTPEHVTMVRERTLDRMVAAMHAIRSEIWGGAGP